MPRAIFPNKTPLRKRIFYSAIYHKFYHKSILHKLSVNQRALYLNVPLFEDYISIAYSPNALLIAPATIAAAHSA